MGECYLAALRERYVNALVWQQKAASLVCAWFLKVSCTAYHIWTKDPVHHSYLKYIDYVIFYAYTTF